MRFTGAPLHEGETCFDERFGVPSLFGGSADADPETGEVGPE